MTSAHVVIPAAAVGDRRITSAMFLLFGVIGSRETRENNRWVKLKQKEMAEEMCVARETVGRLATKLVEMGFLEKRNVTSRARGRISLEYRIRHDLPDNIAENADVISTSLRVDHNGADVTTRSHHNGTDVISTSLPIRDSKFNTDREESSSNTCAKDSNPKRKNAYSDHFLDAWKLWPKHVRQSSKALSWARWTDFAKQFDEPQMLASVRVYLASDQAKKCDDGGRSFGYVAAFERWLPKHLETWIEIVADPSIIAEPDLFRGESNGTGNYQPRINGNRDGYGQRRTPTLELIAEAVRASKMG